jgi:hypothetical protein
VDSIGIQKKSVSFEGDIISIQVDGISFEEDSASIGKVM